MELASKLRHLGVIVKTENHKLKVSAPKGVLTKDLIEEIKIHKEDLLNLLSSNRSIPNALNKEYYPLTSSQRRLWVLSQFEDGNSAYNESWIFELKGNLDKGKLEQSFKELIKRHESLRTSFKEDSQGEVQQFITPFSEIEFILEMLTDKPVNTSVANALIETFYQEDFDLTVAPLLKAKLIEVEQNRHLLLLSVHHIISDGWSMGVLTKELTYSYNHLLQGQEIVLPDLPIQYKDYATWKQSEKEQAELAPQESYWLDKFSGDLPKLELPSFQSRPKIKTYNGTKVFHCFSKDFTNLLKQFSEQEGVTLFMSLIAGINGLFYRYTGNTDIVLGTPVAGREHFDLEHQVGLYLNTLAIRTQFSRNINFKDLISIQKETLLEGYAYQDYPFDQLIDKLTLQKDTSRSALFDVMVVLQNQQNLSLNEGLGLQGIETSSYNEVSKAISRFDMTFSFSESLEGLQLELEYNTDIYDKEIICSLIKHLESFLSKAISNPKQEINHIDYLSKEEKHQLLYEFNDTKADYPKDKTIIDLFVEQVKRTPSNIAVVFENTELTYKKLDVLSNQLANYLLTIDDIEVEDLIGVQLERSEWLIISLLAVMKTGAAYVPIDPNYPERRIAYIKEDSNCKLLIDNTFLDQFKKKEDNVSILPKVDLEPNNLAYVIYTSGSTGKPKGVMIEHKGLINLCSWHSERYSINEYSKGTLYSGIAFDASTWEILPYLIRGGSLYPISYDNLRLDIYKLTEFYIKNGITHSYLPSTICSDFVSAGITLKNINILTGGEVLRLIKPSKTTIYNNYGPTENTVVTSFYKIECHQEGILSIGKPIHNTEIYILSEDLTLQPKGVIGELCVSGVGLSRGYLHREELTKEKFIAHPFKEGERLYRTGDLARWLPDGNIEFIGRKDTQIKLRGYRIELGEIEQSILKFEGVKQALAEVKNIGEDKVIAAYIVSEAGIDKQSLREFIAQSLPEYMIPSYFVDLDTIPLTENGKIDRKALPEVEEQDIIREEYIAPQSAEEQALVDVLEDVLKRSPIGIKDNFYNLGGDSIKSIQVVSRLKQKGHSLKIEHILRTPIVEDLAKHIIAHIKVIDQTVVEGTVHLSPIQHYFFSGGLKITELHHFNQSVVLKSKEELNTEILKLSIADLVTHHDALRMVYKKREPIWEQYNQDTALPCYSINFHDLQTEENELEVMAQLGGKLQSSIDLEKGPLFKVGHFRLSDGDRLALIIHHLVVDGVSWRILLEDLSALYTHYKTGEAFTLPLKTNSFQHWSSAQNQYAQGSQLASEISYWENVCNQIIQEIPKDISFYTEGIESYNSISFTLDKATTELLQTKVHSVYNTEINDLLLTALGMAMHDVFGLEKNMVQMEGHGREEIIEDIDISRTVGWFTSVYPFVLGVKSGNNLTENLVRIKEDLRKVPNKGIGYGILKYLRSVPLSEIKPSIAFNYLGDFGTKAGNSEASILNYSSEYIGQDSSAKNLSDGLLDVTGMMVLDELSMSIRYSESAYTLETIEQLLAAYQKHLTILIEDLSVEKKKHITPSDLTFKKLTIPELSTININGRVEDVYQLSPLQQGIYYHWLSNRSSTMYFEQISYRLRGLDLDIQSVKEAYEGLIARHSILRTSFTNDYAGMPLQVVWREAESHFKYIATPQGLNSEELESYLEEIKLKDREEGFNLEEPSQMRLLILDLGNNSYELIWSNHHILMDGWCMSILLNEFNQLLNTRERNLSKPIPYSNYIQWLDTIDQETSLRYWKDYLSNYTTVAEIPFKIVNDSKSEKYIACEEILKIEGDIYARMDKLCTETGITHNTLIQGVWGYLLSRYNNSQDVVFGSVVSGRPAELPDIENMIGLFINTIPVRVQYRKEDTPIDLLKALQDQSVSSISHHYSNLSEVQSQSELGMSLINHIVVFENYPIQEAIKENTKKQKDQRLTIESVGIVEQTNYDFGITIVLSDSSLTVRFNYNGSVYDKQSIAYLKNHFNSLIEQFSVYPNHALHTLNYLSKEEQHELLYKFNDTKVDYPKDKTIIDLFVEQALKTPEKIALVCENKEISYWDIDEKSTQLALYLNTLGARPNTTVGVCLGRSIEMVIGIIGILKSGASYLPLDPFYPLGQLDYIIDHSNTKFILTDDQTKNIIPKNATLVNIEEREVWNSKKEGDLPELESSDLAYLIYTSGSTGKPKGVKVSHRNLTNFIEGMNQRFVKNTHDDVWLAMTSISFDISILELLWTLTRGDKIVIHLERPVVIQPKPEMDFSLCYFPTGSKLETDKYKLLLEGATYADKNGFKAIWVSEKHFHNFGDQFPNPSVAAAEVSTITKNVKIRSGSVVLPLHDPVRVAEEWSMIDNLSRGRVELSIASGWHPNDFVFAPNDYQNRHQIMRDKIATLKNLWKGDSLIRKNGIGKDFEFNLHPKPIQEELPMWITAAGSIETFKYAGTIGANILTHLLGQNIKDLDEKIRTYRQTLQENGFDPKEGKVALMLHAFVSDDEEMVKKVIEKPFKNYLRNSLNLMKPIAEEQGLDLGNANDVETLLDMGFLRFYKTSSLFGTPESCLEIIGKVYDIGIDEIACLIDFGVEEQKVIDNLSHLFRLKELVRRSKVQHDFVVERLERLTTNEDTATLINRYKVTHIQATPSFYEELLLNDQGIEALQQIKTLLVGGEALKKSLADKLIEVVGNPIYNMYGPTETTIWSSVKMIASTEKEEVTIGAPIANTKIYILDTLNQLCPVGVSGELCIGGDGVSLGYLNNVELTALKFTENPFVPGEKIYKTGDLARWLHNGELEYLCRLDRQVKIRGFRIELKEIENVLLEHKEVIQCVVSTTEQNEQILLIAYIKTQGAVEEHIIKEFLRLRLPHYMVPQFVTIVDEFPYTPNEKIDIKKLPQPNVNEIKAKNHVAPRNELEDKLMALWSDVLKIEKISIDDNFFEIGGNSMKAFQLLSILNTTLNIKLEIVSLFEYSTIRSLVEYLQKQRTSKKTETEEYNQDDYLDEVVDYMEQIKLK